MDSHQGLALFIVDFEKFGYGPMILPRLKMRLFLCPLKDQKGLVRCSKCYVVKYFEGSNAVKTTSMRN